MMSSAISQLFQKFFSACIFIKSHLHRVLSLKMHTPRHKHNPQNNPAVNEVFSQLLLQRGSVTCPRSQASTYQLGPQIFWFQNPVLCSVSYIVCIGNESYINPSCFYEIKFKLHCQDEIFYLGTLKYSGYSLGCFIISGLQLFLKFIFKKWVRIKVS